MDGVELTLACTMMDKFEKANEGRQLSAEETLSVVVAYATIAQVEAIQAQTEQLRRIADILELPYEAKQPATHDADDDPMEEHNAVRKQAREQMEGLRRGMGLE